jgi:hypothetical protein
MDRGHNGKEGEDCGTHRDLLPGGAVDTRRYYSTSTRVVFDVGDDGGSPLIVMEYA